jgi:hypothetical protein
MRFSNAHFSDRKTHDIACDDDNGFGVEIDEWNNQECLDSNANHVGIDSLDVCGDGVPNTLAVNTSPGITADDGNWHTMMVNIANGAFTVTTDGVTEFSSYSPSTWTNGSYYLGFGGGTGGANNYHRVRNVSVTFNTPHCY